MANARSEIGRLELEVSQTRILLEGAQEQIEKLYQKQAQDEHAPAFGDCSNGRRRPIAAAGLSVVTSPAGSDNQQSLGTDTSLSVRSRDATTASANQRAAQSPAAMLFDALDADGDGFITRREMTEGLSGTARGSRHNGGTAAGSSADGDSPTDWYAE